MPTIPAGRVKGRAASSPPEPSSVPFTPSPLRLVLLWFALTLLLLLLLAYLANAIWNLLHLAALTTDNFAGLLAAVTLPAPMSGQIVPRWVEWTSAAAFLLMVALPVVLMRTARRLRARSRAAHNKTIDDELSAMIFIAPRASDAAPRPRRTLQRVYDPVVSPSIPASSASTDNLDSPTPTTSIGAADAADAPVPAPPPAITPTTSTTGLHPN